MSGKITVVSRQFNHESHTDPSVHATGSGNQHAGVPLHCVRCHSDYAPRDGTYCVLPHIFDWNDPELVGISPKTGLNWHMYPSLCCGEDVQIIIKEDHQVEYRGAKTGICFRGWHTTAVGDVEYNYANARPCFRDRDGRCIREILAREELPVFEDQIDQEVQRLEEESRMTE